MMSAIAHAKINLALVVGPTRADGKHEVATVLQRIELADRISLEAADEVEVHGFPEDTLVGEALRALGVTARVHIEKRIPVGAGLGGGSSDAAAVLRLANELRPEPLSAPRLHELAAGLGADVPFFLAQGTQLGTGDGTELSPVELASDYAVLVFLPAGVEKVSTASVYEAFSGADAFAERRAALEQALEAGDLAALPPNDLASSPTRGRSAGARRLPGRCLRRGAGRLWPVRRGRAGRGRPGGACEPRANLADEACLVAVEPCSSAAQL